MSGDFFNEDMELFLAHRVDWERYFRLRRGAPGNVGEELESYRMILRTAADICAEISATSRERWPDEVKLEDGRVIVPPHIAAGYEKLRSAGLVCLALDPEHGGYGLPLLLNTFFLEMVSQADASLMTIVGLQAGVAGDIERYGTEELRRLYLPRFVTGELQGAMDLTEPQAGSDLGAIRTRATEEDGRYFVDGEKIFITNGGADIHLVLARDADSYEKSKGTTHGLSLLLVPVTLPDGTQNGVQVVRTEIKLGIHGSPTCVVAFERAEGFLLGEKGEGFRAMLDLMNNARLGVAAQAIGIAEAAYREARAHAAQRVQFGVPIVDHPLVKNMLTLMAINIQAARALLYGTCARIDLTDSIARHLRSEAGRNDPKRAELEEEMERNVQLTRFLTPLCKYYATEISNDVTRHAIQVHGGIGYMAETRAGQLHSDSIITTIYEGTSEIQASFALKEMSKGALFTALEEIRGDLDGIRGSRPELVALVEMGLAAINDAIPALMSDPQYALLNAKRVCEMAIDVLVAGELLLQTKVAEEKIDLATAYINRHMLSVEMNAKRISSGDATRIQRYDRILGL